LNNNRGNNRRRGRGNRQNNGGGQHVNRIDSRARGNAPQLLEKYRKLAQDAHLNGDRVQAEYYLQFADHYFRVLADTRQRQEEQRNRPQGERWQDDSAENDDSGDFSAGSDFPTFEQPGFSRPPREERSRGPRQPQGGTEEREDSAEQQGSSDDNAEANPYEPAENPFVRENRPRPGLRPRRNTRRDERGEGDEAPAGLDPASLPPAISAGRDDAGEDAAAEAKPRRPRAKRKPSADDAGGEALESVN